jgi:cytochrome c-type biogenesis protein CcmH
MAQSMMARVREMSAEGKSRDEIINYFTERYGDWVLLEPRKEGLNWLVWVMPPVFLLLGLLVAAGYGRRPKDVVASASESTEDDEDPYVRAVRDEVDG